MIEGWQVDESNLELSDLLKRSAEELERLARAGTSQKRMVFRARLILEYAIGADNVQVAKT
jgi:hypothetical protein